MAYQFPNIDPVAFAVGPLQIRWYGISYVVGISLGWIYCRYLARKAPSSIPDQAFDDFLVWATLGIIIGGRLGEVFFYNFPYYAKNPLQIVQIWYPGMSFHGGLIGVAVVTIWFCFRRHYPLLSFADILACAAPIGLFFGRLANFVNSELYGRVTDVPWAVIFPNGGPYPRHPSQLYEAILEGLLLFIVLGMVAHLTKVRQSCPGFLFSIFLIGYGAARILAEFFRQPEDQAHFFCGSVTMGQILSTPVFLIGIVLLWHILSQKPVKP